MKRAGVIFIKIGRIFLPPFIGLPVLMWSYFVLSYMALPYNSIWRGDLPDPDDYTYLSHTLDWLQGQNWFDTTQYRMAPPEGVVLHYTRLVEVPIAAFIMLFRLLHYSWSGAALLTSFLLPVVYLGGLFITLRIVAASIINIHWARLTAFVAMFAPTLMFKFAPGQVDHHGLEAILTIMALGLTVQIFMRPNNIKWAVATGFILALAVAIALEVLPWLVLILVVIGMWTVVSGVSAARATAVLAFSFFVSSVILLVCEKPITNILQFDFLSYSLTYVILAGDMALALLAAVMVSRIADMRIRFLVALIVAFGLAVLYLYNFPALLVGPYGAMDARLAALFFSNLQEAVPLIVHFGFYQTVLYIMPSSFALGASYFFFSHAQGCKKWTWLLLTLLVGAALALTLFYQIRILIYASLFSIIPLVAMVESSATWLATHYQGRKLFWAQVGLILLVGPLTAILLPALQDSRSFNTGILLFPAQRVDNSCGALGLDQVLNAPPYAGRVLRIINMMDQGPELLFHTPHAVMSAPYHTNVRGNLDALDFFSTTNIDIAEQIARHDGIDLVVLCRNIPDMYLTGPKPHYVVFPNGEVKMLPNSSLAGRLAFHQLPKWLSEIPIPAPSNYLLFAVQ